MKRCAWAEHPDMHDYHDNEWGVPLHDDRRLFEALILDGAQAGLSWRTILNKRPHYRKVYDNWDVKKIARYDAKKSKALLMDPGIVRNKMKIASSIQNANVFLDIKKEFGSFDNYLWGFVNHKPIVNEFNSIKEIPAKTELSDKISKDLKKRGMNFVGSTIIYAMLQGVGVVNDHETSCFRWKEVGRNT